MISIKSWRIIFTIIYFVLAVLIVIIWNQKIFYLSVISDSYNLYRYLWCISCSSFGFSVLSFHVRTHPNSPFPSFITYYPVLLFVISALVFSICHLFEATSNFVFYYLSFGLCFAMGYLIDNFWTILSSLIKKGSK